MDTKLKKSKYNPFVKATAFIMTIVCAYLFAFNGVNCLRKGIFFQSQDGSFRNTPAFISAMTDTLINISSYTDILSFYEEDLTFEEFLDSDQAKSTIKEYEEQKEKALLIFNTIQKLKPLEPDPVNDTLNGDFGHAEDNGYYDYSSEEYINSDEFSAYYQNNYSSEDVTIVEFRQEDNFNELLKIKSSYDSYDEWNKKYQELRSAIFAIVDDATNESTITDELDLQCEETLENSYYLSVEQTNEFLDEFVNIDFILKDNETGKCVSTLKKSEQKAFIDTIEDNSLYHVAYNNQKVAGDIISVKSESNVIRFLKDADFLPAETINDIYLKNQFGNYSLYLKVKDNIIQGDIFYNLHQSYLAVKNTELQTYSTLTVIFALLSLAGVVLCCFLCGKRKDDSVKLLLTDKVPFIIALTFAIAGIVLFAFLAFAGTITDFSPDYINLTNKSPFIWLFTNNVVHVFVCLCAALLSFTITSFAMYISRNTKANKLFDRFLIGFIVKRLSKIKAKIKRNEKAYSLRQISKITLISLIGYVVINCFFFLLSCAELYIISVPCLVIFNALCIVYAGLYLSDVIRLTRISEKICTGEHIEEIRPDTFVKPLQGFATNLSAVHDSIEAAVAEAIKGEHLKTELITNVSHDLKTPLTSIINYVSE